MRKRYLGEIEVSEIGMGCMSFSRGYGKIPSEEDAIKIIKEAYELGCRFFDTAEVYGPRLKENGHNERILGKALKDVRGEVTLSSKVLVTNKELEGKTLYTLIKSHLLKTLENLQTDYLDLYYLHRVNELIPVEEIASVMEKLNKEGLIRGYGISQCSLSDLKKAHETFKVSAYECIYNILERDVEKEILPYCKENNIGVVCFSPLCSGLLTGKITPDKVFEGDDIRKFIPQFQRDNMIKNRPFIEAIEELANYKGVLNCQIALGWLLKKGDNIVPLFGSKKSKHLPMDLEVVDLSDDDIIYFEKKIKDLDVYGHRGIIETIKR